MLISTANSQNIPIPLEHFSDVPQPNETSLKRTEKLKLAVAINPESADAWTDLGWRLYKDHRFAECVWAMNQARLYKPNDPYVLWLSGLVSYAMGDYKNAIEFLWELWDKHKTWPNTVDMGITYDVLGRSHLLTGEDLFTASYFLSKAIDEMPNNWQIHFLEGITEWYRERYGESLSSFERALKINSSYPTIYSYYTHARVAVDLRHKYYAKKAAEDKLWPEAEDDERKAIKAYQDDLKIIKKAIRKDSKNPDNLVLLGNYHVSLEQTDAAISAFRKAIALDKYNASARYALAKTLHTTGNKTAIAEVKQLLIQSIALSPHYWIGNTDSPHVGLLLSILIQEGQLIQAQTIVDWLNEQTSG